MKPVLTAKQMQEVDRRTAAEYGIPTIDLMENAARCVFEVIIKKLGGSVRGKRCVVLCGMGNNGGDGIAVARMLYEAGAKIDPLINGKIEETKGDARVNFDRYLDLDKNKTVIHCISTAGEAIDFWMMIRERAEPLDLIVDAVFGTGLNRPVAGFYEPFLDLAMDYAHDNSPLPLLVSIDLPSGVDADRAVPIGFNFEPDVTVAFTAPKLANVMPPVCHEQGELRICDIGSPAELTGNVGSKTFLVEPADVKSWMYGSRFREDSYKKKRGSVLVIAGSKAYPGAAVLAGNGAMRSGAGIVTVATPHSAYASVSERVIPEVMVRPVSETQTGAISDKASEDVRDLKASASAILIGCGLTSEDIETRAFVRETVLTRKSPVVVDADGLNSLSPFDLKGDMENPIILTPHEGEFLRLAGRDKKLEPDERITLVRDFAVRHQVICVLKGEKTLIASPGGNVVINTTGNSGLGKAGNGDNLAGIIAGFAAQTGELTVGNEKFFEGETPVFLGVVSAVYIAGLAGDIAAEKFGKRVMTASDVRDCLADAFRIAESERGYGSGFERIG